MINSKPPQTPKGALSSTVQSPFRSLGLSILILPVFLLSSCHRNPLDIDVSKVNVPPVKIERLE
ncbi:MAG TPA: hypothetical protein VK808_11020, partial [Bacteroidia bacterium]|nr:hypothetical protein [Bacteroidia bacterium]